jgi:hypothetical protein
MLRNRSFGGQRHCVWNESKNTILIVNLYYNTNIGVAAKGRHTQSKAYQETRFAVDFVASR